MDEEMENHEWQHTVDRKSIWNAYETMIKFHTINTDNNRKQLSEGDAQYVIFKKKNGQLGNLIRAIFFEYIIESTLSIYTNTIIDLVKNDKHIERMDRKTSKIKGDIHKFDCLHCPNPPKKHKKKKTNYPNKL